MPIILLVLPIVDSVHSTVLPPSQPSLVSWWWGKPSPSEQCLEVKARVAHKLLYLQDVTPVQPDIVCLHRSLNATHSPPSTFLLFNTQFRGRACCLRLSERLVLSTMSNSKEKAKVPYRPEMPLTDSKLETGRSQDLLSESTISVLNTAPAWTV